MVINHLSISICFYCLIIRYMILFYIDKHFSFFNILLIRVGETTIKVASSVHYNATFHLFCFTQLPSTQGSMLTRDYRSFKVTQCRVENKIK